MGEVEKERRGERERERDIHMQRRARRSIGWLRCVGSLKL